MVRGKCVLARVSGAFLPKEKLVCLSKHIFWSVFTGRQELSLGKVWGVEASLPAL